MGRRQRQTSNGVLVGTRDVTTAAGKSIVAGVLDNGADMAAATTYRVTYRANDATIVDTRESASVSKASTA